MKILGRATAFLVAFAFSTSAQAGLITFSDDTPDDIGSNGSRTVTFNLDDSTEIVSSAQIQLNVGETDEGFALLINGATVFDIAAFDKNDPGHPIGVSPGLDSPWNSGALPRIVVSISETSVMLSGLINAGDAGYTTLGILAGVSLPTFLDGLNSLTIENNNANGPGGTRKMSLSGRVAAVAVPEPSAILLLGMGLLAVGLMGRRRVLA